MRKSWSSKYKLAVGSWQLAILIRCLNLIVLYATLFGCSSKETSEKDTYTCPMHPTVVSDKHGTCPVCGMDLVRKARAGEEVEITEELAQLLQSPDEAIVSNVSTIKGKYQSLGGVIEAQGIITYDTRNSSTISSRVVARLEKVEIKSVYQKVSKGQKLAEIYSPELITAQRELIYLLNNDASNTALIESAKQKLTLLGFSATQLNHVINRKEVLSTISIYSDVDGYIVSNTSTTSEVPSSASMNSGMSAASQTTTKTSNETTLLRSGDYVSSGQSLFKIASSNALRVELSLPSTQVNGIQANDELTFQIDGTTHQGKVDLVQPFTENKDELIRVRIYLRGEHNLKIGELVKATIQNKSSEGLWVPANAVLDLGSKQVVFIKDRGVFKAKEIKVGSSSNNLIEVKGIASTDEIASDAHYLVDSENLIKTMN